jgi:hypothetical protein
MTDVEVQAREEEYKQNAEQALEQASHASSDIDKTAWLLMAQGWLGLLPLIDSPASTTDLPR